MVKGSIFFIKKKKKKKVTALVDISCLAKHKHGTLTVKNGGEGVMIWACFGNRGSKLGEPTTADPQKHGCNGPVKVNYSKSRFFSIQLNLILLTRKTRD